MAVVCAEPARFVCELFYEEFLDHVYLIVLFEKDPPFYYVLKYSQLINYTLIN